MNNSGWPDYAEAETIAQKARLDGFLLKMDETESGWEWIWKHELSGMTFDGSCDCTSRAIAFICALQVIPVVIFSVDPDDNVDNV